MREKKRGRDLNVYLAGFPCSGKTVTGRILAEETGRAFADTDAEIEKAEGMDVSGIVSSFGWKRFRKIEEKVLRRLSEAEGMIIALGGGVAFGDAGRGFLAETGVRVFIDVPFETLAERIAGNRARRPLFSRLRKGEELENFAARLYGERLASYAKADLRVEAGNATPREVAAKILIQLKERYGF